MNNNYDYNKYIPLDKYWTIRMGFLDMVNGRDDIVKVLEKEKNLSGDISALLRASKDWSKKKEIKMGESGTLFRYLQFAIWKLNLNKRLVKSGTLIHRKMCNNPEIVNWPLKKLLKLDNGTSQWASAAVLLGNQDVIKDEPYFLEVTREALKHWRDRRNKGLTYDIRRDEILTKQAEAFIEILKKGQTKFFPTNPDDYCFARALDLIDRREGKKKFPAIEGHESNRLDEMEKCLKQFNDGKIVETEDHRVVQAIALLGILKNKKVSFSNPDCVSKSWPKFWDFLGILSEHRDSNPESYEPES